MDGGNTVMKAKTIYIDGLSNSHTGYTLTISGSVGTGQVGVSLSEPIQGMPHSLLLPNEELPQSISPESQEERFLDEKLREFYRKKGL